MSNRTGYILSALLFCMSASCFGQPLPPFKGSISLIPDHVKKEMKQYTWKPNCPVPLSGLRYLHLRYYGYDHKAHTGVLIVNQAVSSQVVSMFKLLYEHKFPIQSMIPLYQFKGSDEASMAVNNSSSFNCRQITGHPGIYSQHSYGRAIDINTRTNPFVAGNIVLPKDGRQFANRCQPSEGKIVQDSYPYNVFTSRHWAWGGAWYDVHDYQHFEKRVNGQRRNPFGYGKRPSFSERS